MVFKFQRTKGMRHIFSRITKRMREVVHRVDAPFITRLMMGNVRDAVNNRVTHVDVGGGHVNFCTDYPGTIWKFTVCHSLEQV
ncbi:hypothetical protein SDC9_176478 [bioreactor metagenome]|uniref:Uncharacterized protein n=1 Tax=bioreactor metagenome TaxID=1076179 RepID=A0A645GRY4_9ZZZZ